MRILMVCLGNICRSPMAHGILRDIAKKEGLHIEVDSAGTSAFHSDEPADRRAQATMAAHHIPINDLRSRQVETADFYKFDLLFAMDTSNYRNLLQMAPTEEDKEKVKLILNEAYPHENKSVPDPYYGVEDGFEQVYEMLDLACHQFVERM